MLISMMTMAVLAAGPVAMEFDGSLKDGLKQLAQKSGLNLVVIGDLDEHVQLNLPSVEGEEALETIAAAYELDVTRSGKGSKLWVVKKRGSVAAVAPLATGAVTSLRGEAEQARLAADAAREAADTMREQADSLRNASEAVRAKAQEAVEEAREKAQEAAEDAREKAQEAAEAEREQAQEQTEAARDQAQAQRDLKRATMELERNRVSTGGPVTVDKDTRVETAVAYGGPVIVEENAVVDGDAVAFGGDVVLKKNSVVEGDAVSFGGSEVREEGAVVHGESVSMGGSGFGTTMARNMVKTQRSARAAEARDAAPDSASGLGRGVAMFLLQFALFFGFSFVLMMFAPRRMKALEETIRAEPGTNGLAGFLAMLAVVALSVILVVTIIGIPVALLLWVALTFLVPAIVAIVANAVGARIPTGHVRKTQALVLAAGLLVLLLLAQVPVLNVFVIFGTLCLGFGAIVRTRFGQSPRGQPVIDSMQDVAAL